MAEGAGKYDREANIVRVLAGDPEVVIVIIIGGNRGDGFEVQSTDHNFTKGLPDILVELAAGIRQELNDA